MTVAAMPRRRMPRIAVLIPCRNEERAIARVVADYRRELPGASIHVGDNRSTDRTAAEAAAAGATVWTDERPGKGFMVRTLMRRVDADIYVLTDGDGELPAAFVHDLIAPVLAGRADMTVGSRFLAGRHARLLNDLANRFVTGSLNVAFGARLTDVLSGYRALSRELVRRLPLFGGGFEIEAELTVKAVERGYRVLEVPIETGRREEGSVSKVRLLRDGFVILATMLSLFRDYQPLFFFGATGVVLFGVGGAILAIVDRGALTLPGVGVTAGLFCGAAGLLCLGVGVVLHTITRRSQEFEHHVDMLGDEISRSAAAREEGDEVVSADRRA